MDNLTDTLKKVLLIGIGATATTVEKSKDIIDELVKKGEITIDQGKVLNEELKHNATEKAGDAMLSRVEKMTKEERAELKAKLDALDQEEE